MNNNFAYHMSRFMLNYLTVERNLSHNTIKSYRDTFVQLLEYILMTYNIKPENLKVDNVNREVVVDFLNYIESKKSNTITTRNTRLAALRSFFSYLQSHLPEYMFQCQQILNIKCKKKKCKNVSYLTTNEIKQLLTAPDISTRKGLRDLVLLIVLYDTGARVQELCDLVFGDVRLVSPAVITLNGKGGKVRSVPLMTNTCDLLKKYMEGNNHNANSSHPLFFNARHEKLSRQGVTYILCKYAIKVNLNKISPHVIRHSKAMHLTQADINPIYIRDILGHANLSTTGIYARTNLDTKRKALEKIDFGLMTSKNDWTQNNSLMEWLTSL